MLKIRLQRTGRKNIPIFRVVLTDSHNSTKSGKFLEILGIYDPVNDKKEIKADRVKYWISQGAQTSDTVHNFLVGKGVIDGKKINVLPKKSPILSEKEAVPETQATVDKKEEAPTASGGDSSGAVTEVASKEKIKEESSKPTEQPTKEDSKEKEAVVSGVQEEKK